LDNAHAQKEVGMTEGGIAKALLSG